MPDSEYKNQTEKYKYISGQHGGYYRHDFVDHAYLYNLYFPPEEVFSCFKNQIHDLVLNYPVAQDVLASLVGKLIDQSPEHIVVGNGAAELIKIVSGHIARKIIISVPSFNEYANAAPAGRAIEFPLEIPSFQLDVDKFADRIIETHADVAVVVTPNNPTAMAVPKTDLIRLAKKLADHDCQLIIDESFIDFVQDPGQKSGQTSMEDQIETYPNIVIFKSMSKAYGICGLRIGYLLTRNSNFIKAVRKGVHIWNINGFAEEFLRILPDYSDVFIKSCNQVKKDRDKLYTDLKNFSGLTVYKPDANFIFCRLPDIGPSAPELTRRLFIEHNIYIKHCQGKTMPDADRYIRIAARTKDENTNLVQAVGLVLRGDN
ncbi:MAG: histidinol-phosphate aminotransferase family protein [Desulfobacula sp.]|jgi:histidinol-phosphate/aromatic aminotransferase/cobyric acid decarboxylase-like protein|uniref:pyridoxal phosphate-dependent aminotransferase n=1 Tax=Desulfobacula sp. TaxID=2593537 RepID=UPI001D8A954D|nr:histidinol-phosphate aminotransferase family protein [Desulfobacula sp.]MBT3487145.1 histidinol-phosphate aminotransferase family protein [Desulfobacula sp.]MBT3807599.1 histidinol-phosphate aminotransferase family protein [Desulfobacula sp.]MBT4026885.1 histidinol-phosphate aminotransferase family protein [Desulfobacula sp.]MBT4199542.1 histidinol-phosphate aminotransferase family protein [Desulfobacula sp.]